MALEAGERYGNDANQPTDSALPELARYVYLYADDAALTDRHNYRHAMRARYFTL